MTNKITEKPVVLVTGAGKGIGSKVVEKYLGRGYNVVANTHRKSDLLDTFQDNYDGQLFQIKTDLSEEEETKAFLIKAQEIFNRIDIVVNNAGTYSSSENYQKLTTRQFNDVLRVNLLAAFEICQFFITGMVERKFGRIVNVSSISVEHGGAPSSVNYTCSKAGLEALTKSFAKIAPKNDVLVNAIRVGLTDTEFHSRNPNKAMKERIELVPMKRMATTNEIAKTICFYGSEKNTFTTGTVIKVSGGE